MMPIHELLNRIRWDPEFGRGRFDMGYYDRTERTIRWVALREVTFPEDDRHVFQWMDDTGQLRRIPFHRVREVTRDGQIIWQRPG